MNLDAVYHDESAKMNRRWIGVDFDGTLAENSETMDTCGKPIPAMVERVKQWLAEGKEVRIFTARVSGPPSWEDLTRRQEAMIQDWCALHIGQRLRVTCRKDFALIELWDDRANWVESDTGITFSERVADLKSHIRVLEEEVRQLSAEIDGLP